MALFDLVNFNGEVFDALVRETPNLRLNNLLKSGAIVNKPEYASQLPDQQGGNYITTLIKARIGGTADNYDGSTNITSDSRGNYAMGREVVGRAHGWTEKDFVSDISGTDYMAAASEVGEYWDDISQDSLVSTLKGVFAMTGTANKLFVDGHTYDVSAATSGNTFSATTLNNAIQQALGDHKDAFSLAIMHSQVATNLENLNLLEYMKYTDDQGIERKLSLATLNGRMVLIDDTMPTESVAAVGEVPAYTKYTTYVLGTGAIEMTNCGVKVPSELYRSPATNGGETTLYSRQRNIFAPYGISWKSSSVVSPTDAQLATGTNWEIANNRASSSTLYFPHKAIGIAQIITRG